MSLISRCSRSLLSSHVVPRMICSSAPCSTSSLRPPSCQMENLMDVGSRSIFNADHDLFRENVRKFMKEELAPQQAAFEEQGGPTTDIWEKLGAQGLLGVAIPEEAGGIGGTFLEEAIVQEEQAYAQALSPNIIVHSAIVMPYFLNYGTPEQIKKYMPDMTAGKRIGAIGMTEPDAGSDLQGIRTNAKRDGDDYIINGSKTYISNGIVGNTIVVVAVTDPTAKSKAHGISLFIVDKGTKGFKNGKNLKKMGLKGQDTAELFFEDVRVPKENLLGGLNEGFYLLMKELPQERLSIGVGALASAEWCFEETREYVCNRKAFGSTVSSLQTVKHKLAEMKTALTVCRSFIDMCIEQHSVGALSNETASMSKYWATELENRIAEQCVQLHGGMGFMWDCSISRAYCNARVQTIYGGTNEIMKELISRSIVKKQK